MNLYGVFWNGPAPRPGAPTRRADFMAYGTNRRQALALATKLDQEAPAPAQVYQMTGPKYRWNGAWDAPTFRACARRIR